MTISTKHLTDAITNSTLTPTSVKLDAMLASAKLSDELSKRVFSVASPEALPPAANNTGRLIWIQSICDYRYSDGVEWVRDFNSTTHSRNSVWSWGCNGFGRLGDNTTIDKSSPVSVVGGFTDWCQVSVGYAHTAAVRTNGTIWAWGYNGSGRLGDNTAVSKASPVSVVGGFTDWCQVSTGQSHTTAIRTNGTIWSWGSGLTGRLGDNTIVNKSSPVSVVGGFTDWCQVSAGSFHTAAVRTNGTIWAWGYNGSGQLGDNTIVDKSSPVSVVGGFTDWCQVSAGYRHSIAVRTNGTIWAWGYNGTGQLGDNTAVSRSSPVSVVGGFTDWCQVSAGYRHSIAVRTNGTIWAWGLNNAGQLGDNTIVSRSSPVSVVGGFTDWCQVSAGYRHSIAVRTNGTLWAWGCNGTGQLGDNTTVSRSSPVSVVGGFTDWCQVSAGNCHMSAILKKNIGF